MASPVEMRRAGKRVATVLDEAVDLAGKSQETSIDSRLDSIRALVEERRQQ